MNGSGMISRVAESIYWMSRYVERAENIARFIDVNQYLNLDLPMEDQMQWRPMVEVTGDVALFERTYGEANMANVIRFLAFDQEYANSIYSCLKMARENARTVREAISSEMWTQVNKFYQMVRHASETETVYESPHEFLDEVKQWSHLITGVTEVTMSHNEGWHFSRMGRLLERADKTSRILDVKYFMLLPSADYVGMPYDNIQWAAVLKSASALEMYRKTYRRLSPQRIAEFLIFDRQFPRAIRYCLANAEESMRMVTSSQPGVFLNEAEKALSRLRAEIDYTDIGEVTMAGMHQFLDNFQARLNAVGEAIFDTYFALRPLRPAAINRRGS